MTVGFLDLASSLIVPDRNIKKSVKPLYSVLSFGDGYESRISLGTDGRQETYTVTFNNRPIEEVTSITGFFANRAKYKNFDFTLPDSNEPSGEKTITVYCDSSSTIYVNQVVGSVTAKFVRVFELVSGTSNVNINNSNFAMTEGQTTVVNISSLERGAEILYWTLDGGSLADFVAVDGSFNTAGTLTLATGSFEVSTLADVTTEGTEQINLRVRSGSIGGPTLAQVVVTVQDTSRGPETFNLVDNVGADLTDEYLLKNTSTTIYVEVLNYEPVNDLYWSLENGNGVVTPFTGVINLTGNFASSTGNFSVNGADILSDQVRVLQLRKDSVSGPIVDTLNLNVLLAAGAQLTNSLYQPVASYSIGPNSSPEFIITAYFKGTLLPIEQIYWTIEGATAGVDFVAVQGTFLPVGNDSSSTGSFQLEKAVPSPESIEYWILNLRTTGYTGSIIDTVDLVVETAGTLLPSILPESITLRADTDFTARINDAIRLRSVPVSANESLTIFGTVDQEALTETDITRNEPKLLKQTDSPIVLSGTNLVEAEINNVVRLDTIATAQTETVQVQGKTTFSAQINNITRT